MLRHVGTGLAAGDGSLSDLVVFVGILFLRRPKVRPSAPAEA